MPASGFPLWAFQGEIFLFPNNNQIAEVPIFRNRKGASEGKIVEREFVFQFRWDDRTLVT
jgi:hypothetical protein